MNMSESQAIYRVRTFSRKGSVPSNYQGTYEIIDEQSQQIMAYCDVSGHATFSIVSIIDEDNKTWTMKPNRKIMPTRWILTDPNKSLVMQFDRNFSQKLKNPIYRVILTLLDNHGKEVYQIVDPRKEFIDRVLGAAPDDWVIMKDDEPVARITRLVRHEEQAATLMQKFRAFFAPADKGVVSLKGIHLLSAPVALCMQLILHELTASSGRGV
jgi:hypothetical protein